MWTSIDLGGNPLRGAPERCLVGDQRSQNFQSCEKRSQKFLYSDRSSEKLVARDSLWQLVRFKRLLQRAPENRQCVEISSWNSNCKHWKAVCLPALWSPSFPLSAVPEASSDNASQEATVFALSLSLSPCQSLNFKRRLKNKKDKRDYTHSVSQNAELARCRISKSITFASDHLQDRASVVVVAFSEWPPDVLIDFSVIFTSGSIKSSNNWPVQLPNAA